MTMRPGHRHGWAVLTVAVLLAFAAAALASTPKPSRAKPKRGAAVAPAAAVTAPSPTTAPTPPVVVSGLMAFLDPETGQLTGPIGHLVPPADQQAASANVLLTPVRRANGAWLLDLKGTMMDHYVIHIDPLGNRRVQCVQDPRHAHLHDPLALPIAPRGEVR